MNKYKIIGYAQAFVSYIMSDEELWEKKRIKNIILFGSTTRGDFTKDSDVDIFMELENEKETDYIRKRVSFLLGKFSESDIKKSWSLRGIKNEINPTIGTLKEVSDLQRSLITNGIFLFGKYSKDIKQKHFMLFSFEPISNKNKKYRIDRYLYGRNEKNRQNTGMVQKLNGIKINSRAFIISAENSEEIIKHLKSEKMDFRFYDIWSDSIS